MKILTALLLAFLSHSAFPSNYPPDYCDQSVHVIHQGPAIIAQVGSGCGSANVIGYKPGKTLSYYNPDHIDAVVIMNCNNNSGYAQKRITVRLGREYHGNSYVNDGSFDFRGQGYNFCYGGTVSYQIAFSDGNNNWDSNYGQNYNLNLDDFYSNHSNVVSYNSHEGSGFGMINLKIWDFIVGQLRQ